MVVVSITEGLGNQMFQYALYRALLARRADVKAEATFFENYQATDGRPPRSYALGCFPAVKPVFATREELAALEDNKRDILSRVRRRLFGQRGHIRAEQYPTRFERDVFEADGVILRGFWQNPQYFSGVESALREDFALPPPDDEPNRALLAEIESREAAALHIRRGDFLLHGEVFGGICTREYYERAADIVTARAGRGISWYIFTDDPAWARENVPSEARVVDLNDGETAWRDMLLMSRCRHIITANSSFSWWAAWLGAHESVVTPALGPRKRPIAAEERVPGWHYI